MRLPFGPAGAAKAFRSGLFAMFLSCVPAGCGNYCLVGIFNPSGMTSTSATCPPSKPTGNVVLTVGSSLVTSEPVTLRAPHLFVTLRGIDALAAPAPGEDAPVWQPLAPQLTDRPVQVDLTASAAPFCESGPLGSAAVPAGVYSQLRLRVVPNPPPSAQPATNADESACGAHSFSCLIPPDATAHTLAWDDPADIVIASDHIADGFIRILPETSVHVSIALDPRSSLVLPAGTALRLIPSFSASTESACSPTN